MGLKQIRSCNDIGTAFKALREERTKAVRKCPVQFHICKPVSLSLKRLFYGY